MNRALEDLRAAQEILTRDPDLAGADIHSALVAGDVRRVEQAAAEGENFASTKGGPRGWEPLVYVCFSRFANARSDRAENLVETARLLLSYGADPNASYIDERWPDNPLSCLYAATGINNNPVLGRLLLAAGRGRMIANRSIIRPSTRTSCVCGYYSNTARRRVTRMR